MTEINTDHKEKIQTRRVEILDGPLKDALINETLLRVRIDEAVLMMSVHDSLRWEFKNNFDQYWTLINKLQQICTASGEFRVLNYKSDGTTGQAIIGDYRSKEVAYTISWGKVL